MTQTPKPPPSGQPIAPASPAAAPPNNANPTPNPPPSGQPVGDDFEALLRKLEQEGKKLTLYQFWRLLARISLGTYLAVGGLLVVAFGGVITGTWYVYAWTHPPQPPHQDGPVPLPVLRKLPEEVRIATAEVYGPNSHGAWLDDIRSGLQEEGDAENRPGAAKDYRVLWITTKPWAHPTTKCGVWLAPIKLGQLTLTGYGFRVHPSDHGNLYQPLDRDRIGNEWKFTVEESDGGDYLAFVIRLTSSTPNSLAKPSPATLVEVSLK